MSGVRLDAEQVHDAMLALSGELQLQTGGPSLDHSSPCRAIYMKLIRNKTFGKLDPNLKSLTAEKRGQQYVDLIHK